MKQFFTLCSFLQIMMLGVIMNFSVNGQEPELVPPGFDADLCIMGTVVDFETGEQLPGARVWLLSDGGNNKESVSAETVNEPSFGWQMTDENGLFGFYQGVPFSFADRLQLFVTAPGYHSGIFSLAPEEISPGSPKLLLELNRGAE